ncbi:AEC family transporter [Nereida sp. MMG025]|uniref:AEC family transporter n=1 Tax=Nereida sp. MMG025 TaxID=2909981 RepID=UPI00351D0BE5|nr:AEC family transporter [Nereida sp. MMG025]
MNLALTVLEITAPVFLLACIGFVWVKLGFEYRVAFVTRLAMTISVPCLIFVALMETQIPPAALTALSLASVLAYGAVTLLVWILVVALKLNKQTFMAPLIMGNTGNLGLPLALFAFGDVGLGYAVVVFAIMAIYSFTIGIYMVSGGGSPAKMFKEPVVAATLLGALFLWQGWQTPTFLTNALRLTGDMAIPMMLITLGVAVARLTPARLPLAIGLAVAKQVICIGSAAGIGIWLQLEPVALAVLILQVSTPVAVTSYLLAEKYGADAQSVAGLVVVSTVLSLITIPLTLAFLV